MKTSTLTTDTSFSLSTLSLRERIRWVRAQDAATPCGSLLVLRVVELKRPIAGLYSLTPADIDTYFASGYEILPLSSEPCAEGTEHCFLLKKHNALDPTLIGERLRH